MIVIDRQCPHKKINPRGVKINTIKYKKVLAENGAGCFHLKVCLRVW